MNLYAAYQHSLQQLQRQEDPAQVVVIEYYQQFINQLEQNSKQAPQQSSLLQRGLHYLRSAKKQRPMAQLPQHQGLYLFGAVGRGKTYLMDLFFDAIKHPKMRLHYYHFMQLVHQQMNQLQGQKNPLTLVAKHFAQQAKVICIDEFFVIDITDAMILSRLIAALFDEGIYLFTTSNCAPEQLYKNGLQRERFLPAIALLNQHLKIINLDSTTDYRLRNAIQTQIWHVISARDFGLSILHHTFNEINGTEGQALETIYINDRPFKTLYIGSNVVMLDFKVLCIEARSAQDYIELAKCYEYILILDIPVLTSALDDAARRFITMIDEFYDQKIKIFATAHAKPQTIYQGMQLQFEFERVVSRLMEMQTQDYQQEKSPLHYFD